MIDGVIIFIIGFAIGLFFGFILTALMIAAGEDNGKR